MSPGDYVMIDLTYTADRGYQPDAISGRVGVIIGTSGRDVIVDVLGVEWYVAPRRIITDPSTPMRAIGSR